MTLFKKIIKGVSFRLQSVFLRFFTVYDYLRSNNNIYNITGGTSAAGVFWYYTASSGSPVVFTDNQIYSCAYGMIFQLYNSVSYPEVNMTNCGFGVLGVNTTADLVLMQGVVSRIQMYNCTLNSALEVYVASAGLATTSVISRRHDNTPGLPRIWGDYRARASESYRYDQALYTGSGDANVQKIIEFGPVAGAIPAAAYASATTAMLAGSRYAMGAETSGLTLNIAGNSLAPTWIMWISRILICTGCVSAACRLLERLIGVM